MEALRPTSFQPLASEPEQEPIEKVEVEEEALAHVGRTNGWDILTKYMDEVLEELDQMVMVALSEAKDFEQIGQRYVVKELTKDAVNRIKSKVEDARVASDRRTASK